jgi:hypothetical protein
MTLSLRERAPLSREYGRLGVLNQIFSVDTGKQIILASVAHRKRGANNAGLYFG